jgi:hypothetical protein
LAANKTVTGTFSLRFKNFSVDLFSRPGGFADWAPWTVQKKRHNKLSAGGNMLRDCKMNPAFC